MVKVRELIEVLKKMPQSAEVDIGNQDAEYDYKHLLGISNDSESDDFGGLKYNVVTLCVLDLNDYDYCDLIDEDFEIYGDRVWYNTIDPINVYKEGKRVQLKLDKDSKTFT